MAQLTGGIQPVSLNAPGFAIVAPGFAGTATLVTPADALTRAVSRAPSDGTAALDQAFAATQLTEVRRVELTLKPVAPAAGPARLRSISSPEDAIELQVPDLGPEWGTLVLAADENDALTWHLPLDTDLKVQPAATRGAGATKRFRIPVRPVSPQPATAAGGQRSLIGAVGGKLLKVLIYPITDPITGALGGALAERWEARNRAPLVRSLTPQARRQPRVEPVTTADWARLAQGRALLFVHGTFSTSHAGFGDLPDATFEALHQRYAGRVFAYDHATMATTPQENVRWLLQQVPAGVKLDVDIVCHSRGGLVSRMLAEQSQAFGPAATNWRVGKVVMVAVPNSGTPLVDADHMVSMIDRLTTALNVFPSGAVVETLEALITAVKVIGHGALQSLEGLQAMHPAGSFLHMLNQGRPEGRGYRAVGADFEPRSGALAAVAGRLADGAMDMVFGDAPNDLVVPQVGAWTADGNGAFPIGDKSLLQIPATAGVMHTNLFGYAPVADKLLEWLD